MADTESLIEGKGTVKKNLHWFIIGFVCIVIVVAIFAQDSNNQKKKAEKAKEPVKVGQQDANPESIKGILGKQKDVPVENPAPMAENTPGIPSSATTGVGKNAEEASVLSAKESQAVEDARREAQMTGSAILAMSSDNIQQQLAALQSQSDVHGSSNYPVDEAALRAALAPPTPDLAPTTPSDRISTKEEQDRAWLQMQSSRKKTSAITEDSANSPYTIFEGAVIPAVLVTKVSSQLPGDVSAIVSQDVYDGVSGTHLIIPKGSIVYGSYNNNIAQGQSRMMIAFNRLILPNGRTVSLQGMPSADKLGQHGIEGDVNNRYLQRFGFSFFTALLGNIVDRNNANNTTIINAGGADGNGVSTAAGTILVDMAKTEQQRTSQIRSIIELAQGEKFNINVNHDIAISPYK